MIFCTRYAKNLCLHFQLLIGVTDHILTFLIDFKLYGIVIKSLGYSVLKVGMDITSFTYEFIAVRYLFYFLFFYVSIDQWTTENTKIN